MPPSQTETVKINEAMAQLIEVTKSGFEGQRSERVSIDTKLAKIERDVVEVIKEVDGLKHLVEGNGKPGVAERMGLVERDIKDLQDYKKDNDAWKRWVTGGLIASLLSALGTMITTFVLHAK